MIHTDVVVPIVPDMFPFPSDVSRYAEAHDIEGVLSVTWERQTSERAHYHGAVVREHWELIRWTPIQIRLAGVPLAHPNHVPEGFPLQELLKALDSPYVGAALRRAGPDALRAE